MAATVVVIYLLASLLTQDRPTVVTNSQSPAPLLQIVVLQGEGAVNIIQQKTAVAPIVEIRDRNGLPVSGVAVTFAIEGGKAATFEGAASTVTVATNAAGRAAAAAINPVGAGSFQVQVHALYQGQVAATTIAQTNVLTAAEAAAATASTAGTSATAAGTTTATGGGISGTTLAIVGAAVGGGALAASQAGGGDTAAAPAAVSRELTGPISGTMVAQVSFPGGGVSPCTINYTFSGDANVSITVHNETVSGRFRSRATDTPTSFTCNLPRLATNSHVVDFPLTGAPGAVSGRQVISLTQPSSDIPGATQNVEIVYAFSGTFDGNVLAGSFTFERTVLTRGAFTQDSIGRATVPVTFR